MPRGKAGKRGGKNKRKGKNMNVNKRELIYKEDGQDYAKVIKLLGNCRMEVSCFDGKTRTAKVRGKFKRRVWMNIGDLILVDLREDFNSDEKCDIVHKYWAEEVKALKNAGEIPDNFEVNANNENNENGDSDFEVSFSNNEEEEEETKNKNTHAGINPNNLNYSDSEEDDSDEDDEAKNAKFFNNQKKPQESDSESEKEVDDLADI